TDPTGTTTFTWDARNRLVDISDPNVTALFTYDAFDRRVSKETNGQITDYHYDDLAIVLELIDGTPVSYLRSRNIDEPLIRNGTDSYLADVLGSILALTDPTGTVTTRYDYDPFGRTTLEGTQSSNPFQYTGRENQAAGLYYYRARYYSATLHRFLSQDPLMMSGDPNLYMYAENSPVNAGDPLGLFCIPLPASKSEWEFLREIGIRHRVLGGGFFGAIGFCNWGKFRIVQERQTVQERSFCCGFCKKAGFNCRIDEGRGLLQFRFNERILETRRSRGFRMFMGRDIEGGDVWFCKNPWTGATQVGPMK
ncbi:MAG: RHS repeat domain-containing protein, partial [Candidatus Binatia bacterium]